MLYEIRKTATDALFGVWLDITGSYNNNNFSVIAEPLTNLLGKKVKYVWSEACQKSFDQLEATLKSAPVLPAPRFDREFTIAL